MLDSFEILTTSGVVVWSKSYNPVKGGLLNSFIRDVFIEEKIPLTSAQADASAAVNPTYRKEKYTLKWTSAKDLGLIFVAVYQSLLHLTWIDKLLDNIRVLFTDLYGDQLRKPHTSIVECENFDDYFEQQRRELEQSASASERHAPQIAIESAEEEEQHLSGDHNVKNSYAPGALTDGLSADSTPNVSRPSTPGGQVLAVGAHAKGTSRRAKKAAAGAQGGASGDERKAKSKQEKGKKGRRWDDSGMAGEDDGAVLDYSAQTNGEAIHREPTPTSEPVNISDVGTRTKKGQFVLKDLGDEVHSILQNAEAKKSQEKDSQPSTGLVGSSFGAISGLFKNIVGGKVLTKAELDKPIKGMEEHLLNKNVAREAALRLCASVEKELLGTKTGSFESVDARIRTSLASSLRQLLTPTTSLDILSAITSSSRKRPYTISIVGVNGVGKSTSLAKLAFFLLQNNFSLLIAACDTFRSGAVEQLRVHARNLAELSSRSADLGSIELYERGYGKDAANIARDAITYAETKGIDVVLIDTAGRRHNDARLMGSLEKFAQFAAPDKIFMVGEALVGTDSVAQARAFNSAFGRERKVDGFVISKCDTVGEMVGTLVSMVHATGIPVVFLGVGQHYGDLRTLSVQWAIDMLMK